MVLSQPENTHTLKAFDLSGKVAAVTGATRGIGLEVTRALAEAGANVALIYNTSQNADAVAAEIGSTNKVRAAAYQANVADQAHIEHVVQRIAADFGGLDIIVANAGITSHIPAEDYKTHEWRNILDVNLDGAFYTAQAAGRIFKKQGHGNVIFTTSMSAQVVNIPQKETAYNASKAAVVQLAKSLAVEWIGHTRVNCISPGYIDTEIFDSQPREFREQWDSMIPARRFGRPYELKGAYVFAASDASSYMTGADLVIDGGYTLV